MHYQNNLDEILGISYLRNNYRNNYNNINLLNKTSYKNPGKGSHPMIFSYYKPKPLANDYGMNDKYDPNPKSEDAIIHSFSPEIFLNLRRPAAKHVHIENEIIEIARRIFGLMTGKNLPENISIEILPSQDFKETHSKFGECNEGILGFSMNGTVKKIFVRENRLDCVILVVGHEIGHVFTETLPNKQDEEAKAFAFTMEWANTIRKHDIANLGLSFREKLQFEPAKNGLHDLALDFVNFSIRKGRSPMQLHKYLIKKYVSLFSIYL